MKRVTAQGQESTEETTTGSTRVLLVEDDPRLGDQVTQQLRAAGFDVVHIADGREALSVDTREFQLVILDLMLPEVSGMDLLKHMRAVSDVPILMLSAQDDATVKVRALQLGADDYMTKPFWPEELLARVEARIRRPDVLRDGRLVFGKLQIDLEARQLEIGGQPIELTRVEFDLLATLIRRRGSAVQRVWLTDQVLDPDRDGTERTLDVHVSRIRKKIGDCSGVIATVWGVGYRFEPSCAE